MGDELLEENPTSSMLWLLQANAFIGLEQPLRAAENFEMVDALGKSTAVPAPGTLTSHGHPPGPRFATPFGFLRAMNRDTLGFFRRAASFFA